MTACHALSNRTAKTNRSLLQRIDMHESKGKETPVTAGAKLTRKDCPGAEQAAVMISEQRWYRSTVASLIYFVGWTRPDLALAVSQHCKFMHNPWASPYYFSETRVALS